MASWSWGCQYTRSNHPFVLFGYAMETVLPGGGLTSDLMRIPVLGAPIVSRRARRGRRRRIFLHDLSNSLPPWRLSVDEFMEFNLLITLFSGCLKFIAGKPTRQRGLPRRLRSE